LRAVKEVADPFARLPWRRVVRVIVRDRARRATARPPRIAKEPAGTWTHRPQQDKEEALAADDRRRTAGSRSRIAPGTSGLASSAKGSMRDDGEESCVARQGTGLGAARPPGEPI
jgi:hypothetical protein